MSAPRAAPAERRALGAPDCWRIGALLGLLGLCLAIACGPAVGGATGSTPAGAASPSASPPPLIVAAGTPATSSTWRYTVLHSEQQSTIRRDGQFGIPVDAQGVWLLLDVQVENASEEARTVRAEDFEILDARGRRFSSDPIGSATYSLGKRFAQFGGRFRAGMSAPVGVVFDVDPDAPPLRLYLPHAQAYVELIR